MKNIFLTLAAVTMLTACEKPIIADDDRSPSGNVTLTLTTAGASTRATATPSEYFAKAALMLFDEQGNRAFDKVKTQTSTDGDFGTFSLSLPAGTYTIVCVGHSSPVTPTIKSAANVQFTAQDGRKLSDVFCYAGVVNVGDEPVQQSLTMNRVTAMVRLLLTDTEVPDQLARWQFTYTGGSANFSPATLAGITKSSQSETLQANEPLQVFTFPYQSDKGVLKMTVSALNAQGSVIRSRTFDEVPVTRNRITTYEGHFFEDGDGTITQSAFGFSVNGDWLGEDIFEF